MDTMTPSDYMRWTIYFEDKEIERKRAENRAAGIVDFSDPQSTQQLIGMVHNAGGAPRKGRDRG